MTSVSAVFVFAIYFFLNSAPITSQKPINTEEPAIVFQKNNKSVMLNHRQPFSSDFKINETTCIPRWTHEALHLVLQDFRNRILAKGNETNFTDYALVIRLNKEILELEVVSKTKESISYNFEHPFSKIKWQGAKKSEFIFSELKTTKANCAKFMHIDHAESIQDFELILSGIEFKSLITVLYDFDFLFQDEKENGEAYIRKYLPEYQVLRNYFEIKIAYKVNEDPPEAIVSVRNMESPKGILDGLSPYYRLYSPFETIFKRWWPSCSVKACVVLKRE
jgi:hypothetical protein